MSEWKPPEPKPSKYASPELRGFAAFCGAVLISTSLAAVDYRWGIASAGVFMLLAGISGLLMGR